VNPTATVRHAEHSDAPSIAELLGELGYPAAPDAVALRLKRVLASRAAAFMCESDGRALGLCTIHLFDVIHEDTPVAMLSVLIVTANARRSGVGRRLVEGAERWARMSGAGRVVVATGLSRTDAHSFYEALGYEHNARRYIKRMAGVGEALSAGGLTTS
jgi:GNAT superfamily N-acetyltransferase